MSKKNRPSGAVTAQPPRGQRPPLAPERNGSPAPTAPAAKPWQPTLANILQPLASLRLTVVLMLMSMLLVYAGTLAQVDNGIWQIVDKYFWSSFVWVPLKDLIPRFMIPAAGRIPTEVGFPFVGGKVLGFLLLLNLLAAHYSRFKLTWRRGGIWLIHGGLILLLVGEAVTRERAEEMRMPIEEGKSANYLLDQRHFELAFVDLSDPNVDRVAVLPARLLKPGERISNPALPVDIEVVKYLVNSELAEELPRGAKNPATQGAGLRLFAEEKPPVAGTDQDQRDDIPAVYAKLIDRTGGKDLGTWLFTPHLKDSRIDFGGKPFEVSLRNRREYLPYTMHLTKFTHDVYEGTDKPKDFRSHIRLTDPETNTERDLEIYMNAPLRYRGKAFFQSGFMDPRQTGGVRGTILQVVDNPGWLIPYIACVVVSLGLLTHFGVNMLQFLVRTAKGRAAAPAAPVEDVTADLGPRSRRPTFVALGLAAAVVGVFALYLGGLPHRRDRANSDGYDLERLRRVPVLSGGRVQPLDTVARSTLRLLSGREEYEDADEKKQPAIKWFADAMFVDVKATGKSAETRKGPVWEAPVFKIDNDQVLHMLGLKARSGLRYALGEFYDRWGRLEQEVDRAREVPKEKRDKYQTKLLEFSNHLGEFLRVRRAAVTHIPPTEAAGRWLSFDARKKEYMDDPGLRESVQEAALNRVLERHKLDRANLGALPRERKDELLRELHEEVDRELEPRLAADPATAGWVALRQAYRDGDRDLFNKRLEELAAAPNTLPAEAVKKTGTEMLFNQFAPFYQSMGMYVTSAALSLIGLLLFAAAPGWTRAARWPALGLTVLALGVHTAGLLTRMYLQGRPPVTNLYASAIFIGWGAVLTCIVLELIFSYGVANLVGSLIGFCSCLIAHYLSKTSGDTLEMMQAVLDTNFWLATHVTMVTFGYVATFVAGVLGMLFIGLGLFTPILDKPFFKAMTNMLYGVICFGAMLSFIGTVLGGIWADQSWGRFWGWDPKENGAVLVVIWNALILHARWSGLVQQRGMAVLAVLGNVVTTWSWFGTNMLGVGLHSYGFSNELFYLIISISSVSLVVASVGAFVHPRYWMSYGGRYDDQTTAAVPATA